MCRKEKDLQYPKTVFSVWLAGETQSGGVTGAETRQAQGPSIVVRAEPEMGDGPPSRTWLDGMTSLGPGVAAGESQCERPSWSGPANGVGCSDLVG